jgi:hypothetical protein
MPKTRTTITISKDLLEKARKKEINISSFLDIELRRYLAFIEGNVSSSTSSDNSKCGCRDLDPSYKLGKLK